MENLIAFAGELYPINAKHDQVLGYRTWPSLSAIGLSVDLAVIATPAVTLPEIIRECATCGVRAAIIISAGFKETGPEGVALEQQVPGRVTGCCWERVRLSSTLQIQQITRPLGS